MLFEVKFLTYNRSANSTDCVTKQSSRLCTWWTAARRSSTLSTFLGKSCSPQWLRSILQQKSTKTSARPFKIFRWNRNSPNLLQNFLSCSVSNKKTTFGQKNGTSSSKKECSMCWASKQCTLRLVMWSNLWLPLQFPLAVKEKPPSMQRFCLSRSP